MKASPRILVMDDNRGNRHFAQVLLKPEGFTVLQAGDLQAALELLATEAIDIVLADVRMPGGGGFELHERLRGTAHSAIPFLLMSANLTPQDIERARQCAGLRLAERPYDAEEYIRQIREALAGT